MPVHASMTSPLSANHAFKGAPCMHRAYNILQLAGSGTWPAAYLGSNDSEQYFYAMLPGYTAGATNTELFERVAQFTPGVTKEAVLESMAPLHPMVSHRYPVRHYLGFQGGQMGVGALKCKRGIFLQDLP